MKRSLLILAALLGLSSAAAAETKTLPPGEIRASGDITFGNALKLGKRESGKTIITPDTLQILGSGSTGDASAISAAARTLSDLVGFAAGNTPTIATLRALPTAPLVPNLTVSVAGYFAAADGGGGLFTWSPASTAADDGGLTIKPANATGAGRWRRIRSDSYLTPEMFGAIADGASHPLSTRFGTLPAAQAVYPHATALTQEIDWAAIMAALNAGPVRLNDRTYWLGNDGFGGQLGDFVLQGPPGTSYRDYGNGGIDDRVKRGAFLHYTGTGTIIDPNPDVATRIILSDFAFRFPTANNVPAIRIKGNRWFQTDAADRSPQLTIRNIGGFTSRNSNGFGSNAAVALECLDPTDIRAFFGAVVEGIYGYGFRDVLRLAVINATDASNGRSNWINGNKFRDIQGYQSFRALNLNGGDGNSSITANFFENISNQYGADASGNAADGYVVRADRNVTRNTFINVNGFDASTRAWNITNFPNVANKKLWNTALNCLSIEAATPGVFLYGPSSVSFSPALLVGGSPDGIAWAAGLNGELSVQGDLVTVRISGILTSKGTKTGDVAVGPLPIPAAEGGSMFVPLSGVTHGFFNPPLHSPAMRLSSGGTYIDLIKAATAGDTYQTGITAADLTGGGAVSFEFSYIRK